MHYSDSYMYNIKKIGMFLCWNLCSFFKAWDISGWKPQKKILMCNYSSMQVVILENCYFSFKFWTFTIKTINTYYSIYSELKLIDYLKVMCTWCLYNLSRSNNNDLDYHNDIPLNIVKSLPISDLINNQKHIYNIYVILWVEFRFTICM